VLVSSSKKPFHTKIAAASWPWNDFCETDTIDFQHGNTFPYFAGVSDSIPPENVVAGATSPDAPPATITDCQKPLPAAGEAIPVAGEVQEHFQWRRQGGVALRQPTASRYICRAAKTNVAIGQEDVAVRLRCRFPANRDAQMPPTPLNGNHLGFGN
jgi:hypothetical protein